MTTMDSSWRAEIPRDETELIEERQGVQGLLSHFAERSTSAPPLPSRGESDSSVPFSQGGDNSVAGGGESNLWQHDANGRPSSSGPIYLQSRSHLHQTLEFGQLDGGSGGSTNLSLTSRLLGSEGRATAPVTLFSSRVPVTASPASSQSIGGDDSFDFERVGEHGPLLMRSQSAAPELAHERRIIPPPPGMTYSGVSESIFLDSPTERGNNSLSGPRRPASTGVIGQQNPSTPPTLTPLGLMRETVVGGAVRPAPKTLMDLIQEDFPKSASPLYQAELSSVPSSHSAVPNRCHDISRDRDDHLRRVECYSGPQEPSSVQQTTGQYEFRPYGITGEGSKNLSESMEYLQVSQRRRKGSSTQPTNTSQSSRKSLSVSQMNATPEVRQWQEMKMAHLKEKEGVHRVRKGAERDLGRPNVNVTPLPQSAHFENRGSFHSSLQTDMPRAVDGTARLPTQLLQSGHAVYLNSPPYGYALQYHAGAPQQHRPHVMHHPHQSITGSRSQQDYVSIVPIHGGTPSQVPAVSGTYAYWHPSDVPSVNTSVSPAVTVVNPSSEAAIPVTQRWGSCFAPSSSGGGVGHASVPSGFGTRTTGEKGRSRRTSGQVHRRSGGNSDIQSKQALGTSASSVVLDEFRTAKNRDWTVSDIRGHIVEFCQDQNGSRLIQQRLEIGDTAEQQFVMLEVLPAVRLLRNDVFGNYVVQKLLDRGTSEMKARLRDTLKGEMLPLSLQMYGCRVVQKALETLDEDDLPGLLMEFHHNVLSCIHDQNGNHVIQKCIEVMSSRANRAKAVGDDLRADFLIGQIDFLVNDVLGNVSELSCHPYGCRVLQRILEHLGGAKKTRALEEISRCHRELLDDQYGNYVIQHVLKYGRHSDRESVLSIVVASGILTLSRQKFASNVVEKLLQHGTASQRNVIVREMLKVVDIENGASGEGGGGRSTVVLLMVRDAYANYVVQTTLDVVAEGEEKRLLLEELNSHSTQLRNYAFAKHIATKLSC